MKNLLCLLALLLCTTVFAQPQQVVVGVSGNGYVTRQQDGARITQRGVTHWTNPKSIVSIYFYLHQPTTADLSLYAKGHSEITFPEAGRHVVAMHCFAFFGHCDFIVEPFSITFR